MAGESSWKFYVALFVALLGVAIPVWLWRSDLQSKSLTLKVVSQTNLTPDVPSSISGINLTFGGVAILNPHLTVLELVNDGAKPVTASDYESSLEIEVVKGAPLVRAQVAGARPHYLKPKVAVNGQIISVGPLLLNPEDSITLALVTSGKQPTFDVRARVEGVGDVKVASVAKDGDEPSRFQLWLGGVLSFVLLTCYGIITPRALVGKPIGSAVLFITGMVCAPAAVLLLVPLARSLDLEKWEATILFTVTTTVAFLIAHFVERGREKRGARRYVP